MGGPLETILLHSLSISFVDTILRPLSWRPRLSGHATRLQSGSVGITFLSQSIESLSPVQIPDLAYVDWGWTCSWVSFPARTFTSALAFLVVPLVTLALTGLVLTFFVRSILLFLGVTLSNPEGLSSLVLRAAALS